MPFQVIELSPGSYYQRSYGADVKALVQVVSSVEEATRMAPGTDPGLLGLFIGGLRATFPQARLVKVTQTYLIEPA